MKRQFSFLQSGFTLFELMIVIAIIGVFMAAVSMFDWRPQTEIEKADRLQGTISSLLRSQIQNIRIGKMTNRSATAITAARVEIEVSTGGLITRMYSGATSTQEVASGGLRSPFFDQDPRYEIESVGWGTGNTPPLSVPNASGTLVLTNTDITYSGPSISIFPVLGIKVKYGNFSRWVFLDRRTGKISEKKQP